MSMNFPRFLKAISSQFTDLRARQVTGVFTCGCEVNDGQPVHGDKTFRDQRLFRRVQAEFDPPAMMLQLCFSAAQRQDTRFYGRIAVEFDIFEGIVVDTRNQIKQTFH
jgi:hypothetical protein